MQDFEKSLFDLVRAAIDEDLGLGDLTSLACLEPRPMKAAVVAKQDGVLSGLRPALLVFELIDSANRVRALVNDGGHFSRGDTIIEIEGFNQTILASERTALNFMAHLSGIATLTDRFVKKIRPFNCKILDTRKTTPGWRWLEKIAVRHGGGTNHRQGLYDMILIKDNHIASAGSVRAAVRRTREFLSTPDFRLQFGINASDIEIEVEVTNERQLVEAIETGVKRLLLDNQSTGALRKMVERARTLNPEVVLEASGNVSLETVANVAATGVDFISVGALTHSAPAADFSLKTLP